MNQLEKKATVIIRSIGERTERLCHSLILAQGVPEENIYIVREVPFSASMKKSFEIGLKNNMPWTFCVDADVLLRPGSISELLLLAEQQEKKVCEIQGYVLDKFFGGPRDAGQHLYRTALLSKVIEQIPPEGCDIRPETYTLNAMKDMGFPYLIVPHLVGLHDFEQYYRDIFRKCFVHAHKHMVHTDLFVSVWRDGAVNDLDYRVALMGYAAGISYFQEVLIDSTSSIYEESHSLPFEEKSNNLTIQDFSLDSINKIITRWVEPKAYLEKFPYKRGLIPKPSTKEKVKAIKEALINKFGTFGYFRLIIYMIGSSLIVVGNWLRKRVLFHRKSGNQSESH